MSDSESGSSFYDDASEDSETGLPVKTKYWIGGSGDTLCEDRFRVVKMLGDGRLSTVYEALDTKSNTRCAVKVYRYGSDNKRYFSNELSICKELASKTADPDHKYVIAYIAASAHLSLSDAGANIHPCIVYRLYGESLFDFMKSLDTGISMANVRKFSAQILRGLKFMHTNGIVHADIKTPNILLTVPLSEVTDESQLNVIIADIGMSTVEDSLFEMRVGTQEYLSPEMIFGVGYDHTTDIWSFACVVYEMITGDYLFDIDEFEPSDYISKTKSRGRKGTKDMSSDDESDDKSEDYTMCRDHLIMIESIAGRMPDSMVEYGRKYYNKSGTLKGKPKIKRTSLKDTLLTKYSGISESDASSIDDFLMKCLKIDRRSRSSVSELLKHKFLANVMS